MMKKILYIASLLLVITLGFLIYNHINTPKISVIMLTYKRAEVMPRALESILNQTYKNFELIIINDGSPDNTDLVIKKYLKDPRIRYYKNKKNQGIAYSRNIGFSLAKGKYIAIMDDDDYALPQRLEKQLTYLENTPQIDALAGQIKHLPRIPQTHDEIATGLILYNNFGNSNIMYKRAFAQKHNITYDESLIVSEDWDYWLNMLFNGAKFASIADDILERDGASIKHYKAQNYEEGNPKIREKIGKFLSSSDNSNNFYNASACQKINQLKSKNILSKAYLQNLEIANNCQKN